MSVYCKRAAPGAIAETYVFCHVQKTGGTNLARALREVAGVDFHPDFPLHTRAINLKAALGEHRWREAYKFAFVRNPYDRWVSWYFAMPHMFEKYPTFPDFIANRATWQEDFRFSPTDQWGMLHSMDNELLVDEVYRYEVMDSALAELAVKLAVERIPMRPRTRPSRPLVFGSARWRVVRRWGRGCVGPGREDLDRERRGCGLHSAQIWRRRSCRRYRLTSGRTCADSKTKRIG